MTSELWERALNFLERMSMANVDQLGVKLWKPFMSELKGKQCILTQVNDRH